MLQDVSDSRLRELIFKRAKQLESEPEKQGKPLLGELAGLRSVRAVGQRYRILYRVERNRVIVLIVAMGIRKEGSRRDIYALAKKLLRAKLIE
jgi:mRNA interferase RelE/StbE